MYIFRLPRQEEENVLSESLMKEGEKQSKQLHDFQQSISTIIQPPPPPPRNHTINELKTALMAQPMVDGAP